MSIRRKRLAQLKNKKNELIKKGKRVIISSPDGPLMIIILAISIFGIMAIFSAGAPEGIELYHNPGYYVIKHLLFLGLGVFFMINASKYDYRKLRHVAIPFAIVTILLIVATYIPGLGRTSYGASRWLVGLPIQPSELAKIASVLLVATALTDAKKLFSAKIIKHLFLICIMVLLILKQPNLSISMLVTFVTAAMLVAGGISGRLIGGTAIVMAPILYQYIMHTPYQLKRITGWLHPWADPQGTGYNLIQSWYAIGSGGFWGVGFGNSKQKLFWLPFRHTDFIFAVIAEELGFIGCIVLIGLFLALIYRGFLVSNRCEDTFGRLVAFGLSFSLGLQAFINIAVATGVMPITGVTLPLISYGGSSVVVTMTMLGILLNISRKRVRKIQPREIVNEYKH